MEDGFLHDLETFVGKIRSYVDAGGVAGQTLTENLHGGLGRLTLDEAQRTLIISHATATAKMDFEKAAEAGKADAWAGNLVHCFRDGIAKAVDGISMIADMEREGEDFPGAGQMLFKILARLDLVLHDISHNYKLFLSPAGGAGGKAEEFIAAIDTEVLPDLVALQARLTADGELTAETAGEISRQVRENYGQGIDHIKAIPPEKWVPRP